MPTQPLSQVHPSPSILPCEACAYDLNGLGTGTYVVCPECGLEQPRRTRLPPWPTGWDAAAWQCGVTFVLCNLCLVLLLLTLLAPGVLGIVLGLAAITFLSGPVVPIVTGWILSRRHEPRGIHSFILLGWLANFLIGAGYLVIAFLVGVLTSM